MTKAVLADQAPEIDAIAQLATQAAGEYRAETIELAPDVPGLPNCITVLFRDGAQPEAKSLRPLFEEYRATPERRTGTAKVTTLKSFIDLTNRHKDESSVIFASTAWPNPSLTAVVDYHTLGHMPRFGKHRILYAFPLTEEFKAWVASNGKPMSQGDFAAFVEDRMAELAAPTHTEANDYERLFKTKIATPSEMTDLSRGLSVRVAAQVKNATMLQSGEVDITFREEHQNDKGEKITVPGVFMVAVPAFVDGEPVRIAARLRYRLREGALTWAYQLYRWEFEIRNRVCDDLDTARMGTELPAFEGSPEI